MPSRPVAVVLGDINLVRPLARGGIVSALASDADDPTRFSRHVCAVLPALDPLDDDEKLLDELLRFARAQPEPPALVYQSDATLLFVSRHRERLGEALRFPVAAPDLVEALVDKERFAALAAEHDLPVPLTARIGDHDDGAPLELTPPLIVKPFTRSRLWLQVEPDGKAVRVETAAELAALRARMADLGLQALAQQLVPGPETLVESYHAYLRADGELLGEFTGRKIRTLPHEYGFSTAVEVTPIADVRDLGRRVFERIGLTGAAKADFKRAPDGSLKLLEINPRFNLWHYPGAAAGVNLPALAVADVTGRPVRPAPAARRTATWCVPLDDVRAAREAGLPMRDWARFAARCDTYSSVSLLDPLPFVRGRLLPGVARKLRPRRCATR